MTQEEQMAMAVKQFSSNGKEKPDLTGCSAAVQRYVTDKLEGDTLGGKDLFGKSPFNPNLRSLISRYLTILK